MGNIKAIPRRTVSNTPSLSGRAPVPAATTRQVRLLREGQDYVRRKRLGDLVPMNLGESGG